MVCTLCLVRSGGCGGFEPTTDSSESCCRTACWEPTQEGPKRRKWERRRGTLATATPAAAGGLRGCSSICLQQGAPQAGNLIRETRGWAGAGEREQLKEAGALDFTCCLADFTIDQLNLHISYRLVWEAERKSHSSSIQKFK